MSTRFPAGFTEVSPGQPISAGATNALQRQIRHLSKINGPGVSMGVNGVRISRKRTQTPRPSFSRPPQSYLQLTLKRPVGWELPDGEVRTPLFLSFGAVGMYPPVGIDEPIFYFTPIGDGTRHFYLRAVISDSAPFLISEAPTVVDAANQSTHVTPPFTENGAVLPPHCFIYLGALVITDGVPDLLNTGNGSIGLAAVASGMSCAEDGTFVLRRQLTHWRTHVNT